MLTLLLLHSRKGEDTAVFNEVLMALLIAGVSNSVCYGTAEFLKRWCLAWVCMFRLIWLSLRLLAAETLLLILQDLSRRWQKSCRSNFLLHGWSYQLGMRFVKTSLWFGHARIRPGFLLNWGLDKLKTKKRDTWFLGFKSILFIPSFSRGSDLRVGFQEIFV